MPPPIDPNATPTRHKPQLLVRCSFQDILVRATEKTDLNFSQFAFSILPTSVYSNIKTSHSLDTILT